MQEPKSKSSSEQKIETIKKHLNNHVIDLSTKNTIYYNILKNAPSDNDEFYIKHNLHFRTVSLKRYSEKKLFIAKTESKNVELKRTKRKANLNLSPGKEVEEKAIDILKELGE